MINFWNQLAELANIVLPLFINTFGVLKAMKKIVIDQAFWEIFPQHKLVVSL